METHSSILAWEIPLTGGWQTTAHAVAKSWTRIPSLLFHTLFPCGSPQDIEYNSLCCTVESGCLATKYIAMVVVQLLGRV